MRRWRAVLPPAAAPSTCCVPPPAAAQQMRSSISGHARWVDHVTKMSDVHAEHAPGTLMDPTDQWGALGAHVVAAIMSKGCAR